MKLLLTLLALMLACAAVTAEEPTVRESIQQLKQAERRQVECEGSIRALQPALKKNDGQARQKLSRLQESLRKAQEQSRAAEERLLKLEEPTPGNTHRSVPIHRDPGKVTRRARPSDILETVKSPPEQP